MFLTKTTTSSSGSPFENETDSLAFPDSSFG